jgi:putative transposase
VGPGRNGLWRTVDNVELATLGWVHPHNNNRLRGLLRGLPSAEFEEAFYATKRIDQLTTGRNPIAGASTEPRAIQIC